MDTQHSELLHEVHRELKILTEKVESAFEKDDDGKPDFAGHRLFHKRMSQEEALLKQNKSKILRDLVTWAIMGILAIIGGSIVNTYIIQVGSK